MRKIGYVLMSIGVLVLGIGGLSVKGQKIAEVEGYKISQQELELVRQKHKANVANEFVVDKGIIYDEDFWTTPVEGVTPQAVLDRKALEECIAIKKMQVLALEWGLEEDISYQAFEKKLEEENIRRQEKLSRGEVVYGPKVYQRQEYYAYCNRNREIALCNEIIKRGDISEVECLNYYEANKEARYHRPDTYTLQVIKEDDKGEVLESSTQMIGPDNMREYEKRYPGLVGWLESLEQDREVCVEDGRGSNYKIKCQSKVSNGYLPLESVRSNIEELLAKQELEALLKDYTINHKNTIH